MRPLFQNLLKGFVFLSAPLLFLAGCARLDYVKVPTPTQYSSWSDEQQAKADKMKGVRYYLPRPFLHLKQSTPVSQRVTLVSFHLENNKYVLDLPADAPSWVKRVAPKEISITQALAATVATQPAAGGMRQQSTAAGATNGTSAASSTAGGPNTAPTTNKPPSELHARTGFINDTDPVTRLGDRMDVVYLPDFEEQYVIKPKAGLGTADIETRLRNGWAAEVFAQKVDNSNLIPYAIEQFERASEAAAGIFTTWAPVAAGLPPGTSPASLLKMQSSTAGEAEKTAKNFLGDVLLFKIAEVRVAQPGLYPILKPREIFQWMKYDGIISGHDSEATFEIFLRNAKTPWIRPDMAFIPCPPFTMIGFNVTTDVFIAPATERVSTTAQAGPATDSATLPLTEAVAKIKKALEDGKGQLDANTAALLKFDSLEVTSAGAATSLKLASKQVIPDAQKDTVKTHLKDWAKQILKVDPSKVDIDPSLDGASSTIDISLTQSAPDIAGKLTN